MYRQDTVYVSNINDARLKRYHDSIATHNEQRAFLCRFDRYFYRDANKCDSSSVVTKVVKKLLRGSDVRLIISNNRLYSSYINNQKNKYGYEYFTTYYSFNSNYSQDTVFYNIFIHPYPKQVVLYRLKIVYQTIQYNGAVRIDSTKMVSELTNKYANQ